MNSSNGVPNRRSAALLAGFALVMSLGAAAQAQTTPGSLFASPGPQGLGLMPSSALSSVPAVPSGPDRLTASVATRASDAAVPRAPAQQPPALATTEYQRFVQETTGRSLPLFGYDLFTAGAFPSLQNVPVPTDYVLGPGDEIDLKL